LADTAFILLTTYAVKAHRICAGQEIMDTDGGNKKKLDKDMVHYYNFLIKKLYPSGGVRRNQ
jgi:hypothetical protein